MAQQTIVITGNPISGFAFYGPWSERGDAIDWAQAEVEADWWIASLNPARPEEAGQDD